MSLSQTVKRDLVLDQYQRLVHDLLSLKLLITHSVVHDVESTEALESTQREWEKQKDIAEKELFALNQLIAISAIIDTLEDAVPDEPTLH